MKIEHLEANQPLESSKLEARNLIAPQLERLQADQPGEGTAQRRTSFGKNESTHPL